MADFAKIIEEIKGLTVVELNDLVKAMEEEFGVSAAAPVMVAGGAAAGGAAADAAGRPSGDVPKSAVCSRFGDC